MGISTVHPRHGLNHAAHEQGVGITENGGHADISSAFHWRFHTCKPPLILSQSSTPVCLRSHLTINFSNIPHQCFSVVKILHLLILYIYIYIYIIGNLGYWKFSVLRSFSLTRSYKIWKSSFWWIYILILIFSVAHIGMH